MVHDVAKIFHQHIAEKCESLNEIKSYYNQQPHDIMENNYKLY